MALPHGKRKIESIDLTGAEDEKENFKHQRKSYHTPPSSGTSSYQSKTTSSHDQSSENVYQTPASSAQFEQFKPYAAARDNSWDLQPWVNPSTQDDADAEIEADDEFDVEKSQTYVLYGVMPTKVVGVRYYNGRATVGELVVIKREPSNPVSAATINPTTHTPSDHPSMTAMPFASTM